MENLFPLGNFYSNAQEQSTKQPQMQQVDFTTFNADHFFEMMRNINALTENDLIATIKNYIDLIVDKTLSDDPSMGFIIANPKFVSAYYKVMQTIPVDYERRLFANKLTYEYSISDNQDPNILIYFKEISEYVNRDIISKLMTAGLSKKTAEDLAVCRYSSRHENINIQRLNFTMCRHYDSETFTVQRIVWVYEKLFDRVSDLIISSMLEVYSDRELNDFGDEFRDIYGNISLAILVIWNNMPSTAIRQIILKYIDAYEEWVKTRRTIPRFTIRALSYDYERIVNIVDKLLIEGYNVP